LVRTPVWSDNNNKTLDVIVLLKTKLICTEGIPGSGKSSTAQYLSRMLDQLGHPNKWWYEEVVGHPVYVYNDAASAIQIVNDLSNGNYRDVIVKALNRWEQFAEYVDSSDEVILIDGCLLGYLTWSLFPNNVAEAEIVTYLKAVEVIIKKLNPCLIYFYQDDLDAALRKIINRRGNESEKFMIERVSESLYGKTHDLIGFDGVVTYWKQYRKVMDHLYDQLQISKLKIENLLDDWPTYYDQIKKFIGIVPTSELDESTPDLHLNVGNYSYTDKIYHEHICTVQWESGKLFVDGLPQVWTNTELLPNLGGIFDVASLPFKIRFLLNPVDSKMQLHLFGPALLDGNVKCIATKIG
jgi:thymidylate kinase